MATQIPWSAKRTMKIPRCCIDSFFLVSELIRAAFVQLQPAIFILHLRKFWRHSSWGDLFWERASKHFNRARNYIYQMKNLFLRTTFIWEPHSRELTNKVTKQLLNNGYTLIWNYKIIHICIIPQLKSCVSQISLHTKYVINMHINHSFGFSLLIIVYYELSIQLLGWWFRGKNALPFRYFV